MVWALIPKSATLLLEGDEVPDSDDCVLRDVKVEELNAGKGAEGAELAWCTGEVVSHKEPICREDPRGFQDSGMLERQAEEPSVLAAQALSRCIPPL